jgi:hypothetical protein
MLENDTWSYGSCEPESFSYFKLEIFDTDLEFQIT